MYVYTYMYVCIYIYIYSYIYTHIIHIREAQEGERHRERAPDRELGAGARVDCKYIIHINCIQLLVICNTINTIYM